jgi:hypothetical protein
MVQVALKKVIRGVTPSYAKSMPAFYPSAIPATEQKK